MRQNSSHSFTERGEDFYPTPECATKSLIALEKGHIPDYIWEPACGDGAIAKILVQNGYTVHPTDLIERGYGTYGIDYLSHNLETSLNYGIITNPPFKLANKFVSKAVEESNYSAWLLRLSWLESIGRMDFFKKNPPARVHISSRRLPMMHRAGWCGPVAPSNICFAWFIFERGNHEAKLNWFDWKDNE